MKRAIEGNLKYANRVRCYVDYAPYSAPHASIDEGDYAPSAALQRHVQNFYDEFFGRNKSGDALSQLGTLGETAIRQYVDCRGIIYVLVFDNQPPESYTSTSLTEFNDNRENTGKMVLYEFRFDNTVDEFDAATAEYTVHPWYVNQKLYGNFDYQFILNDEDAVNDAVRIHLAAEGEDPLEEVPVVDPPEEDDEEEDDDAPFDATFDPTNCTVTIRSFEIRRAPSGEEESDLTRLFTGSLLGRVNQANITSSSFSMKNVLDNGTDHEHNYSQALMDYKIFRDPANPGYEKERPTGQEYFQDTVYPVPRYYHMFVNGEPYDGDYYPEPYEGPAVGGAFTPIASGDAAFTGTLNGEAAQGFYFIYTLPETTFGYINPNDPSDVIDDDGYLDDVEAAYTTAPV